MTPFRLARLNIIRHPVSSAIAIFAIAVAVTCGGVLLRLNYLSQSRLLTIAKGGEAVIGAKSGGLEILMGSLNGEGEFPDFLPLKLFESLRSQQSIHFEDSHTQKALDLDSIIPFVYFAKFHSYRVIGTDSSFYFRPRKEEDLTFSEGRAPQTTDEVVLGAAVAKKYDLKPGDSIDLNPWIGSDSQEIFKAHVSGILNPTYSRWDESLFADLHLAKQTLSMNPTTLKLKSIWGPDVLHFFLVYIKPSSFSSLENLINKRTVGQVISVAKEKQKYQDFLGLSKTVSFVITFFVLILGGISVCSLLMMKFESVALQMALLQSLGYTRLDNLKFISWQALSLSGLGILLGALGDKILLDLLRALLGPILPGPEIVDVPIIYSAGVWATALTFTVIALIIPFYKICRQNTHDLLKGL